MCRVRKMSPINTKKPGSMVCRVTIDPGGFNGNDPMMYSSPNESAIFLTGTIKNWCKKFKHIDDFYIVPAEAWNRRKV